jgi:methylenetetrahydrofolate reductase (NADPH)
VSASPSALPDPAAALPAPLRVSFEFFPPKTEKMNAQLWDCVRRLEPLRPAFVSVTYGAGGSTRERTHDIVTRIARETAMKPAAHLTCVGSTVAELEDIAGRYWADGIRHIVALRGDPPDGIQGQYRPTPGGCAYAVDLVRVLRRVADFEISVAAYPETHPQAASPEADLDNLKRKIDAGATRAITQVFFDNDLFLRFRDRAAKAGIAVPLVPGILPVLNFAQASRFGATMPARLATLFEGLDEDPETRRVAAATYAVDQCRGLIAEGIRDLHFYTLNKADLAYAICHILGVRPDPAE